MRNDLRKKLLADYAVALVAERESWARLHEPELTEAERCRILGEWKQVAAGLKTLVRQLRDLPTVSVPDPSRSECPDADCVLPPEPAEEWDAVADADAAPTATMEPAQRRPFHVQCLLASLRLMGAWRAKLETAVPRLGSL